MSRYFIVLDGTRSGVRYVIAEVVREPNDEGQERELSLAGNLAGSSAMILTEEELRASSGGRLALEHWRRSNDHSFVLDTMAHDLDVAERRAADPGSVVSLEEAHLLVERGRQRARELRVETDSVREHSRTIREALRGTLEKIQMERSKTQALLTAIEQQIITEDRPRKRRHLRSVS
jgi:hypothetical protein